jgi:hypothetical protein
MRFNIETESETAGLWIAEMPEIPGALAYGKTEKKAVSKACALALDQSDPAAVSKSIVSSGLLRRLPWKFILPAIMVPRNGDPVLPRRNLDDRCILIGTICHIPLRGV